MDPRKAPRTPPIMAPRSWVSESGDVGIRGMVVGVGVTMVVVSVNAVGEGVASARMRVVVKVVVACEMVWVIIKGEELSCRASMISG